MPFNPFSIIASKIYAGVAIFALSLVVVQTVRIEGVWFIDGFKDDVADLTKENAAILAASKAAGNAQKQVLDQSEDTSATVARGADNEDDIRLDLARARADAYARVNRVRKPGSPSCKTAPSPETGPPEDRDGPGEATDMVAVTRNDFDLFVENSNRLASVKEWGDRLIEEKLAIPEVEFAREVEFGREAAGQ